MTSSPPKTSSPFEELTLSDVWELEALIAMLERKGVLAKQEILDCCRSDATRIHLPLVPIKTAFSVIRSGTFIVTHVLNVFNSTGRTAQQARQVLEHLQVLVEIGERAANKAH